ncbi:hypothetical protein ACOJQI_16190 [Bacillus salacetis]|uniref:hypothetical protein n=1 Tax=Bacillus salacetis TaxID=2315464 RepID=UPI003B9EB752
MENNQRRVKDAGLPSPSGRIKKFVFSTLMTSISVLLQASGTFIPVIGVFISPFATLPILLSSNVSIHYGALSYICASITLGIISPEESLIFFLTTGALGLVLGAGLHLKINKFVSIFFASLILTIGSLIMVFLLEFPLLGPLSPKNTNTLLTFFILIILFITYSFLWEAFGRRVIKKIERQKKKQTYR